MQNINILHHAFVRGNLLCKKLIVQTKEEDKQNDQRKDISDVYAHPFLVLASSVKFFQPHPRLETQKSRYTREPSGSRRLLTRKSSKSRTAPPNTSNPLQLHTL